jgi:endonuclease/exonuclease/phosphatase (EEP) superfamily protein YafD
LENARRGHAIAATWPPRKLLGVPIDHILHSESMIASEFRVLTDIGSDHLPIMARLGLVRSRS